MAIVGVQTIETLLKIYWKSFLEYCGTKNRVLKLRGGAKAPRRVENSRAESLERGKMEFLELEKRAKKIFFSLDLSWPL